MVSKAATFGIITAKSAIVSIRSAAACNDNHGALPLGWTQDLALADRNVLSPVLGFYGPKNFGAWSTVGSLKRPQEGAFLREIWADSKMLGMPLGMMMG